MEGRFGCEEDVCCLGLGLVALLLEGLRCCFRLEMSFWKLFWDKLFQKIYVKREIQLEMELEMELMSC